ncbi:MAG: GTP cyclohydrolase I [Oscillibacter sp.]|nr:GTP cyclohydrolase I [Oscillibacter sp.]
MDRIRRLHGGAHLLLHLRRPVRYRGHRPGRLQLQERIGTDIAEIISLVTNSKDIAVIIEGKHSCMSSRGIKKVNSTTVTSTLTGRFKTDSKLQIYLH